MTKRHFEDFARRIKMERDYVSAAVGDNPAANVDCVRTFDETLYAASLIARVAATYSPRFDRARFFKACGITS